MACIAPPPARYRRALLVSLVVFIVLTIALGYTRLLSLDNLLPTDMHIPVLRKPRGRTGADRPMSYGETARPAFKDLPHPLATLDPALVPAADNNRRLIIIGDVHGMLAPLDALLKKLNHSAAPVSKGPESAVYDDHLVFLGDMVNKGPNTPGVIDLLLRHNASAVRGNHEDRVLLTRADRATPRVADESAGGDEGPAAPDNLEQQHVISSNRGNKADHDTLRSLSAAHLDYLASLPAILDLGPVPGFAARRLVAAHAGLVPGVAPEKQDPWAAMNMRTLTYPAETLRRADARETLVRAAADALRASPAYRTLKDSSRLQDKIETEARAGVTDAMVEDEFARTRKPDADRRVAVPSEAHDGHAWAPVWDAAQKRAETDEGRIAVVYGHDAKRGLHVGEYAFGLDSGCVRGGKLSALVVAAREGGPVEHHVVQVDCEKPDKRREL
ncbi:hypothetical protein D7B24_006083 [Verticillium nonalfalfae]|uniref:Calcineurin-like phosphoesterase domain-containing protein n=1 Tax=Verticillium nonalfalfae TaxID=1051616 RepID=A0A3M9YD20_9PEZI|nr:uncharacterized protein D7B24_006083 [Verticillium nonalfalfae]RNJ57468.1 hypothetical protein D7B24_006083 [Verticillium nonalfalfae]